MRYPEQIGFAADLTIGALPASSMPVVTGETWTLLHLADLFVLHETVLLRSDVLTLHFICSALDASDLETLAEKGRIRFFAPLNNASQAEPVLGLDDGRSSSEYLSKLHLKLKGFDDLMLATASEIVPIIEKFSVSRQVMKSDAASDFQQRLYKSLQEEFFDLPHPPRQPLYHDAGFRFGIGRILDVWSTGTLALYLDLEMLSYLEFCDARSERLNQGVKFRDRDVLTKLHRLNNLPTLATLLLEEKVDKKRWLSVVLGDEASELRQWLQNNLEPDLDVRDKYFQTLKLLPSKKSWASWLRFGSITTLSSGLSLLLASDPILAGIVGVISGALDVQVGEGITRRILDPYHPQDWVSHMEKVIKID